MNITEDYVSFEVAKLLKENGFDGKCLAIYYPDGRLETFDTPFNYNIPGGTYDVISAPTLQMVQKWLREKHKIVCNISIESRNFYYYAIFLIRSDVEAQFQLVSPKPYYETYESACEAAIKYCLEKFV